MVAGFSFSDELPSWLEGKPELLAARNACVVAVEGERGDVLSWIDVVMEYVGELLGLDDDEQLELGLEVTVGLLNVASWDQEVSLEVLERAYGSPSADSAWATSGVYLKRGVGLLQFVEQRYVQGFPAAEGQKWFGLVNNLKLELQFLQQLSVVVLSLSKLRSKVYRDHRDAVLDFQDQDVAELATNSSLYARLVIGCLDTAARCDSSSIVNGPLLSYLNSLIFLLMSLDQYSQDQCGLALGMVEQAGRYLSRVVDQGRLSDSILARRKKTDFFKNALGRRTKDSGTKLRWITRSKKEELIPVLALTLDDFVIPLFHLLRYRYRQMNEKMAYQVVETDEAALRRLFPRGKAPELKGSEWFFNRETSRLQEVVASVTTTGYY